MWQVAIPSWVFLMLAITPVLIYAPAFWTRVPYYPTSSATYALLLAQLPQEKQLHFIDLGCGFGDLIFFLAKHRPEIHFTGVEIGILPYLIASCRKFLGNRKNVSIRLRSIWILNLNEYDMVYAFLSPAPMPRLWEKVSVEMRPDCVFITNSFVVPAPANEEIAVKDSKESILYLHRIGAHEMKAH